MSTSFPTPYDKTVEAGAKALKQGVDGEAKQRTLFTLGRPGRQVKHTTFAN